MNALLIICRTVGCANGKLRVFRNNAEEVKGCAKSGNKAISCFRIFGYGMYRKDKLGVEDKKNLYSLFLYTISNTLYICIIYYTHAHMYVYVVYTWYIKRFS